MTTHRSQFMTGLACVWLAAVCWVGYAQDKPVDVLVNGGFEDVQNGAPSGWTKQGTGSWGLAEGLLGKYALSLTAQAQGGQNGEAWAHSTAFPVTAGKLYLLVFWCKGPEKWPRGAEAQIYWYFRQAGGAGMAVPQEDCVPLSPYCCPGKWQVGQSVVRAPAEAAGAVLGIHVVTSETTPATLLFDGLRVTEYQPPEPGKVSHFYGAATYGQGGEQVDDPQSTAGRAWRMRVGKQTPGGKISGPVIMGEDPGQWQAVFRLKVADNTSPKPVAYLRITTGALVNASQQAGRTLLGTDFARPNEYQDFPVEFIRSPLVGLQYLVDWYGGTDLTIDGVTVREEKLLSDLDWAELYRLPAAGPLGELGTGALVGRGLECRSWHLEPALGLAGAQPVTTEWFYTGGGGVSRLDPDFPQRATDLTPYGVVVLADASLEALGFAGRQALRQWVEAGGGLLVLGGYFSYGRGAVPRSFLEDVLPVTVSSTWDLAPAGPGGTLRAVQGLALPSNLDWTSAPRCLWLHKVGVKPGAKVVLKAGDQPFLVVGEFGKGRVACCTGTVLGKPAEGEEAFWEWGDWPKVLFAVVDYLKHGRDW